MNKQSKKIKELETKVVKLQTAVKELKVLNEIAVSSGRASDVDQILNLIVQKSVDAIEAEQGSILLITSDKNNPFKTIIRQDDTVSLNRNYHIGINITGWVLYNKEPLIIENLTKDKRFNPSEEEKKDIHSVLCVPIWAEGVIIGLMMLINKKNKKHFSQDDLTLLSIISVQAGQLIKNLQLQNENFEKRKETEKLHELDKIKTIFFTNISHELRTPLTLIQAPAKQILEISEDTKIKEEANVIYRNAKKLNRLVNQMLDLAAIEAGKMKLKTSRINLIIVVKNLVSSFQAYAERKDISLSFKPSQKEIIIYADKDKLDKILNNILSNAVKFTPKKGSINIETKINFSFDTALSKAKEERNYVEIIISDSGIGIPEKQINSIFDRFFMVDNVISKDYEGTGIGLSLTKELVELHKGKIYVESKEGKGSVFKIILPLGKKHLQQEEIYEEVKTDENIEEFDNNNLTTNFDNKVNKNKLISSNEKPLLLIVEDNKDIRKYIINILNNYYKIVEAEDGEEGLDKSFEIIPDLIISDIMMPKIDGIKLCSTLKTDPRTSHIPIILLTAKAAVDDKIEGLETGADDYIVKPFEPEELLTRIKNLLEQRKRLHEHFKNNQIFYIEEGNLTPMDKQFLKKTIDIINKHISDSSFGVEVFAKEAAVSRSLLHKKLIALTGEPPSELIKIIRLNKAAHLIEHKTGNISEIALDVGFNNPSYFTECFRKKFKCNPSEYPK